ncbi:MAG: hypothetical protein H7A33_05500 [Deltaproteobacteria bacterium]|nr:hypothetical protein [Deltaproteobacteria bacterium]
MSRINPEYTQRLYEYLPKATALTEQDSSTFDPVPDGTIRQEELKEEQIPELIARFLKTTSEADASTYRSKFDFPLRVLISQHLNSLLNAVDNDPELAEQLHLTAQDLNRLKKWLKNDFRITGNSFGAWTTFSYWQGNYKYGYNFYEPEGAYKLDIEGEYTGNSLNIGAWTQYRNLTKNKKWVYKFYGEGSTSLRSEKETENFTQTLPSGEQYFGEYPNEGTPKTLRGEISSSISTVDSKATFWGGFEAEKRFEVLPDSQIKNRGPWLGFELRQLTKTNISISGDASYNEYEYSPPEIEDRQTRSGNSFSSSSDISTQWSDTWGMTIEGEWNRSLTNSWYGYDKDLSQNYQWKNRFQLHPNLFLNWSNEYEFKRAEEFESNINRKNISSDHEISEDLELDWQLGRFSITPYIDASLIGTTGSLNGWYPSYVERLDCAYQKSKWKASAALEHSGFFYNLNYIKVEGDESPETEGLKNKSSNRFNVESEFSFDPFDNLEVGVSGYIGNKNQSGFRANDAYWHGTGTHFRWRITKSPSIWLSGSVDYSKDNTTPDNPYDNDSNSYSLSSYVSSSVSF